MTTNKIKNLLGYVMNGDISEHHVHIIGNLFNALYEAKTKHNVKIDHSSDNPNIMTLDLDQVRHAMREYSGKLITNMEIIDALSDLHKPRLLSDSVSISRTGNNGYRIMPVRLDYSQPPIEPESDDETLEVALDGSQSIWKKTIDSLYPHDTPDELDQCDASRRWVDHAMKLEKQNAELQKRLDNQQQTIERVRSKGKEKISELKEQHNIDQKAIANLRAIITELSETLHAADANARISITASDMLELMQNNTDTADTPF